MTDSKPARSDAVPSRKQIRDAMYRAEKKGWLERKDKNERGETLWGVTKAGEDHVEQMGTRAGPPERCRACRHENGSAFVPETHGSRTHDLLNKALYRESQQISRAFRAECDVQNKGDLVAKEKAENVRLRSDLAEAERDLTEVLGNYQEALITLSAVLPHDAMQAFLARANSKKEKGS